MIVIKIIGLRSIGPSGNWLEKQIAAFPIKPVPRVPHDSPIAPTCTSKGPGPQKHQNSTRRHPEKDKKSDNGAGEEKKARNLRPPTIRGPTLRPHHDTPDPEMDGSKMDWPEMDWPKLDRPNSSLPPSPPGDLTEALVFAGNLANNTSRKDSSVRDEASCCNLVAACLVRVCPVPVPRISHTTRVNDKKEFEAQNP